MDVEIKKTKEEDINMDYFIFSYINLDLNDISVILDKSFEKNRYNIKQDSLHIDLPKKPRLGGNFFAKAVFFTPKNCNDKTIMISNYSDGWVTLGNFISNKSGTFNYSFSLSKDESFINKFAYWDKGKKQRVVYTMKDPKWMFYEQGTPLWFEDTNNYRKRFIKDRLNYDILISYCEKLNINVLSGYSD